VACAIWVSGAGAAQPGVAGHAQLGSLALGDRLLGDLTQVVATGLRPQPDVAADRDLGGDRGEEVERLTVRREGARLDRQALHDASPRLVQAGSHGRGVAGVVHGGPPGSAERATWAARYYLRQSFAGDCLKISHVSGLGGRADNAGLTTICPSVSIPRAGCKAP
jgi:hypothetical protein